MNTVIVGLDNGVSPTRYQPTQFYFFIGKYLSKDARNFFFIKSRTNSYVFYPQNAYEIVVPISWLS